MKTSTSKTRRSAAGKHHVRRLAIESLEERRLLGAVQHPIDYIPLSDAVVDPTPAQMQGAYGVNNIKVGSVVGNGAGQTIALIDVGNENSISTQAAVYSDMQGFDATFGLPDPPSFQVLNENGGTTLPAYNSGWSGRKPWTWNGHTRWPDGQYYPLRDERQFVYRREHGGEEPCGFGDLHELGNQP